LKDRVVLSLLTILSLLGAALFYSPKLGLNLQFGLECPLCPHVLAFSGSQVRDFFRSTLIGGFINFSTLLVIWILAKIAAYAVKKSKQVKPLE